MRHNAPMHPNARLIETFYHCFQKRDPEGMIACYHADIEFSDPVFQDLRGASAGAMWRMLAQRVTDLDVQVSDISADENSGRAHWEARYPFSETGRRVHNRIDAEFAFKDGKIIRHRDRFDLWKWAAMALGSKGLLLGWLPPVQRAIRRKAMGNLERFIENRS